MQKNKSHPQRIKGKAKLMEPWLLGVGVGGINIKMLSYLYRSFSYEIRMSLNLLIVIMGIPYLKRWSLYWDGAQIIWWCKEPRNQHKWYWLSFTTIFWVPQVWEFQRICQQWLKMPMHQYHCLIHLCVPAPTFIFDNLLKCSISLHIFMCIILEWVNYVWW